MDRKRINQVISDVDVLMTRFQNGGVGGRGDADVQ